jgi:hypothetical protein
MMGFAYQSNPAVKIATSYFSLAYLRHSMAKGLIEKPVLTSSPL